MQLRGIRETDSLDAVVLIRTGYKNDKHYLPKLMAGMIIMNNPSSFNQLARGMRKFLGRFSASCFSHKFMARKLRGPMNLEGNAKRTEKEKKRYYHTAYASCQECKTILRLAGLENDSIADVGAP